MNNNWQIIDKIYANYRKKQVFIFHFSDEVEKINKLIEEDILDPASFRLLKEQDSMEQLSGDPFTKKGWEYLLGM